jgi:hypothetical protein
MAVSHLIKSPTQALLFALSTDQRGTRSR